jgi:hypothetical protein
MNPTLQTRIEIFKEAIEVLWISVLVKLHIKKVTPLEKTILSVRIVRIRELIKATRGNP